MTDCTSDAARPSRRSFMRLSGATLGWLAIGCADHEIVAAPPSGDWPPGEDDEWGGGVTPWPGMDIETKLAGPVAVSSRAGELLAYVGPDSIFLWPAGGSRPGPRIVATASVVGMSGAYGLQIDRPRGSGTALSTIYSVDGERTWEIGLDMDDDASRQGRGPDFVLAYDNAHPTGDRFRMAPGGFTLHSPTAGTPSLLNRFHIVGGNAHVDRAQNVLYVQAGSHDDPGVAHSLIRGQGFHPDFQQWGREVFWVGVDGIVTAKGVVVDVTANRERDLVVIRKEADTDRGWLCWNQGNTDWRMGITGPARDLVLRHGEDERFRFAPDGTAYADTGWVTFSPEPPAPPEAMSAGDWKEWAATEARKPVKPYDGIPTPDHPEVVERARQTGRDPEALSAEEHARYGKDMTRVAIGTARWADQVHEALAQARSFDEFRRLLGLAP
jgi:hypothetical protein